MLRHQLICFNLFTLLTQKLLQWHPTCVCQGRSDDNFIKFCHTVLGGGNRGWEAEIIGVVSLIAAFIMVEGAWHSQRKQPLQAATYLPCGISRGTAGKERFFFFIVILFGMTDKPLAAAKEVETLGGLCWLAVSRQGHDRKTGDVAQSYGVNPITPPACIRFWHFRCLMTSHLALR